MGNPPRDNGLKAPPPLTDNRICVLMNAASGKDDKSEQAERMQVAFDRYPGRFELRMLDRGQGLADACRRAMKDGFGTIVAAGGDGTIAGVAGQLAHSERRMGIIALGTFNFVARGLGIPEDVEEAIDLIATGEAKAMPVGEVNGQIFLNNASLGIYPQVLREREGTYKRWGRSRIAAHWSVLVTFLSFRSPVRMAVRMQDRELRTKTPLAFVGRSAYQLEHFGLAGADCVRRGEFALYLAPDCTRMELLLRALRLAGKGMVPERDFELICGKEIEIATSKPMQTVAMDGERMRLRSPFRFVMHEKALNVIMPADARAT
ncbi:diacylglycerol kinase [Thalassococcus profundi]|uniref:Diacylglycerol kinase n=1 Tax=Thalassococcus profundi TaxID=2282382 RepID=A0A369TPB4_9RHOB|nr:diacylglycerol kinase family protein [Thalassococcus profundi]RDD67131.1 diacylglycerol kinase [Thalassococcus profundi]